MIRYSPPAEDEPTARRGDVLGRDFFSEVMPAGRLQESQTRFQVFMAHGHTTDRFSTTFPHDGETIKVQFALATISERAGRERLALVRSCRSRSCRAPEVWWRHAADRHVKGIH